ncbi:ABC transporter permease [Pseudonocardia sp. KRD-184]|uniref:ABC transporter permease n=1 Tax=Pseudonocardia oceani TaxID=2792013 RepID=A0ABS6U1X7_9PSEU|nr:ABC transporter permease [Pseudonocardia oceani]MBW0094013.1 ABC transporter permease [Pseudonocardia oceani]MBW0100590.1 ABC transporter permease [Pseudonocardia oceani]MBW0113401.1 ABC transporter permease [Pseudonocardia oceani]MBW0126001.1 ABC transporter permease [Pseudonocardia oceani]MBW0126136.1 ABC transporter permease [Pseudonocardia oceani]
MTVAPVAARPGASTPGRRRRGVNLRGAAFVVGLVLALEVGTAVLGSRFFPPPSRIAVALVEQLADGRLASALLETVLSVAGGLAAASVVGVLVGLLLGSSDRLYAVLRWVIEFLRPLPSVSLVPFAILLLGVGPTTTIAAAAYAALWPVLFNTYYGVRDVNPVAIDSARTFGLTRAEVLRRVVLPLALPGILTGIRVASAIALVLVITVELLTAAGGVGYFISFMQSAIRVPEMYAGVLVVGVLGYLIALGVQALERRLLFWNRPGGDR